MSLVQLASEPSSIHPVKELALAGLLNKEEGSTILDIYKLLINYPLDMRIDIISKIKNICLNIPISPLDDPNYTCEYINHGNNVLQSTRLPSLFSNDNGLTWHDLDKRPNDYYFWYELNRLIPPIFVKTKQKVAKRKLYFVEFPYDYNSTN